MSETIVVTVDDETVKLIEEYNVDVELAIKCLLCRLKCPLRLKGKCPLKSST